jgi:hypothetical protein
MAIPVPIQIVYKLHKGHISRGAGRAKMNVMSEDELLRAQLKQLRMAHSGLDEELEALGPNADVLTTRRLKKRKLALKDQIARLEDQLYPDIIA